VVICREEILKIFVNAEAGASVIVVDAVVGEQVFELAGLRVFTFVAAEGDEGHPAVRFEDAAEFSEGAGDVEPVEGASGGDHGDRCVGEAGGFGSCVEDFEARVGGDELLAD